MRNQSRMLILKLVQRGCLHNKWLAAYRELWPDSGASRPTMRTVHLPSALALLLTFLLSISRPLQAAQPRMSVVTVALKSGAVATSRMAAAEHRISRSKLVAGKNVHLWILALPADKQTPVYNTLTTAGIKIIHSLPGDTLAWLVHADVETIQAALDAHDFVTVAPFPPSHKLSQGLMAHLADAKTSAAVATRTLVVVTAGVEASGMQGLVEEVKAELQAEGLGADAQMWAAGTHISVKVSTKDAHAVAKLLANRVDVTWIELAPENKLHS